MKKSLVILFLPTFACAMLRMPSVSVRTSSAAKLYVPARSRSEIAVDGNFCRQSTIVKKNLGIDICTSKADCNARLIESLKRLKEFHEAGIRRFDKKEWRDLVDINGCDKNFAILSTTINDIRTLPCLGSEKLSCMVEMYGDLQDQLIMHEAIHESDNASCKYKKESDSGDPTTVILFNELIS